MKIAVTGGAGFIGSHLTKRLVKDGHQVIVIDNLSEGRLDNLEKVKKQIRFVTQDVLNWKFLKTVFKNIDCVFHLAALTGGVQLSIKKPLLTNRVNIEGTLKVLSAARKNNVQRVILASSAAVYGNQTAKVLTESLNPNPLSPYALSKLAGEMYARQFHQFYGMETVALRCFNVFGPGQNLKTNYAGVIPIFANTMLKGQRPIIFGNGRQTRDFIYIDNVIDAYLLAMKTKLTKYRVFNVASSQAISINQLVKSLNQILKTNIKPIIAPARTGEIKQSCGSIRLIRRVCAYQPKVNFMSGLKKTIAVYHPAYEL